jgi:drug/metabolite transporter (DMT)-like permease
MTHHVGELGKLAKSPAFQRRDDVPRGIAAMIVASVLFAASNALAKYLVAIYPVGEVMFLRSSSALLVCSALILPVTGLSVFATTRTRDHIARGLSQSVSQTFTVIALSLMPLAGVLAIGFSAPLWAAVLSILWLKEPAGPMRWAVLLVGFAGVLLVTNPSADAFQLGALFALANAIMYGSVTVAVRGMAKTERPRTLLMWQMVTMTGFHALLLPLGFAWPSAIDAMLLVALGAANAGAQYFWTKALSLGPAAAVSPFYYLMLVWGIAIGFIGWGEVPGLGLTVGSGLVCASGLLLLWHETRSRKTAITPAPAPQGDLGRRTPLARWACVARLRPRSAFVWPRLARDPEPARLAQRD